MGRMSGRNTLSLAVASVLSLGLAACGGGGGTKTNPPPPTGGGTGIGFTPTIANDTSITAASAPSVGGVPAPTVIDATYGKQLVVVNAGESLSLGAKGSGIGIGVLDSGVRRDHPALTPRVTYNGFYLDSAKNNQNVDYVLEQGPALPRGHQTWMMNEVNKLIWPSTAGIGQMDAALFEQTAGIAQQYGIIANPPSEGAYVIDYAKAALEGIEGDTMGADYQPAEVTLTAGGQ